MALVSHSFIRAQQTSSLGHIGSEGGLIGNCWKGNNRKKGAKKDIQENQIIEFFSFSPKSNLFHQNVSKCEILYFEYHPHFKNEGTNSLEINPPISCESIQYIALGVHQPGR